MRRSLVRGIISPALLIVAAGTAWAAPLQQPGTQTRNEILQAAASPFEHLSELAVVGDWKGAGAAIQEFETLRQRTREALAAGVRQRFESETAAIHESYRRRDQYSLALQAADAYRTLVAAQDAAVLAVPIEVSLLDYAGFKLTALLSRPSPDWQAVQATAGEARKFWAAIEGRLTDKSLHTLTTTVVDGLVTAARDRDRVRAQFAAQVDLDLVDVLEGHFMSSAARDE